MPLGSFPSLVDAGSDFILMPGQNWVMLCKEMQRFADDVTGGGIRAGLDLACHNFSRSCVKCMSIRSLT